MANFKICDSCGGELTNVNSNSFSIMDANGRVHIRFDMCPDCLDVLIAKIQSRRCDISTILLEEVEKLVDKTKAAPTGSTGEDA